MAAKGKGQTRAGVIIRRDQGNEAAAHHGGAWKVAYADFVTAMMAFFLLMWLINTTTEEQRKGLADYFSDQNVASRQFSGFGEPFAGHTQTDSSTMLSDRGTVQVIQGNSATPPDTDDDRHRPFAAAGASTVDHGDDRADAGHDADGTGRTGRAQSDRPLGGTSAVPTAAAAAAAAQEAAEAAETRALEQAAQQVRDAVRADPALAAVADQLKIEVTPEGLRIQLEDAERRPMFATGSAAPNERARALLQKVAMVLAKMPEDVSVSGHTDAAPYPGPDRTNWELSSERANATRRLLTDQGVGAARFRSVVGRADREPLVAADPLAPANRRIAILVHRQVPATPAAAMERTETDGGPAPGSEAAMPAPSVRASLPAVLVPALGAAPPAVAPSAAPSQR